MSLGLVSRRWRYCCISLRRARLFLARFMTRGLAARKRFSSSLVGLASFRCLATELALPRMTSMRAAFRCSAGVATAE